ncbi:MAG: M1 family metallopeptidase [Gemmatimonadaceae bacterium]
MPVTTSAARAALLLLLAAAPGALRAQPVRPYRPAVDVLDYELTLTLPDTGTRVSGRATLRVLRVAPLDTLVLDLVGMEVTDARVGGAAARFAQDSAAVRIALPAADGMAVTKDAPAGGAAPDTLLVSVAYQGAPRDGLIITRDSLGRWMAFGDNWPNRARNWIPSVDHPSDKATVTWVVDAPEALTVVANGTRVSRERSGPGRALTHWREARPIPVYLMVIAAAPLVEVDLGESACGRAELRRCVRQTVYAMPESRDFLPGPFTHAHEIVGWFSEIVGPFPYEKLAHLESSTRFGGMENASAIFYAASLFRRRSLGPGIIAHETAHQWFGDAVTEREWSHLWLSEGFATYFEELWRQRFVGDTAFRRGMAEIREQIVSAAPVAERPVLDTAETNYLRLLNANSYQKGGYVLHMLRTYVGDSAFFRGVRSYYAKHRHSTALTDDLRAELESASGQPLGWFFDQWLRRPGWAEVATRWTWDAAARQVTLEVRQGERFGPYRLPLEVRVTDAAGRSQTVRVDVPAERESRLVLPLRLTGRPRAVTPDPKGDLLAVFTELRP